MPPTPQQQLRRDRIESVLALVAPALDLMLAAGDRIARTVGPEDDYVPIRAAGEAFELGRPGRAQPSGAPEPSPGSSP